MLRVSEIRHSNALNACSQGFWPKISCSMTSITVSWLMLHCNRKKGTIYFENSFITVLSAEKSETHTRFVHKCKWTLGRFHLCIAIYISVYMCMCERGREREGQMDRQTENAHMSSTFSFKASNSAYTVEFCVHYNADNYLSIIIM